MIGNRHIERYALAILLGLAGCQPAPSPKGSLCDLGHGVCSAGPPTQQIVLSIEPRPIRPMQPLQVKLRIPVEAQHVTLRFDGLDMDMGPNQIRLQNTGPNEWSGTATIPLCITGDMNWKAVLNIHSNNAQPTVHEFGFRTTAR